MGEFITENNGQEEGLQAAQEIAENTQTTTQGTTTAEQKPQETPVTNWFDLAKAEFEGYNSPDEIKSALRSLKENEEYLKKKDTYTEMEKFYEQMQTELDPQKIYGSKENYEAYMTFQNLKKSVPESIASTILSTDLNKTDGLQVAFLGAISKDPSLLVDYDEQTIKLGLLQKAGVDISDPEFNLASYKEGLKTNPGAAMNLNGMTVEARQYFQGQIDAAKKDVPVIKDWKQEFSERAQKRAELSTQRANQWSEKAKELVPKYSKYEFKEKNEKGEEVVDFTFDVSKEFLERLANDIKTYGVENDLDATPENVAKLESEIQAAIKEEHFDQMMRAYRKDIESRVKKTMDDKVHNPKPINTQEAPEGHEKSLIDELNERKLAEIRGQLKI